MTDDLLGRIRDWMAADPDATCRAEIAALAQAAGLPGLAVFPDGAPRVSQASQPSGPAPSEGELSTAGLPSSLSHASQAGSSGSAPVPAEPTAGEGPVCELSPAEALAELEDRFSGTLQFGTAGLRGQMAAGPNRMNRAVVIRAAKGLIDYLNGRQAEWGGRPPRVVIGNDARHHSREFAEDSAAVIHAAGGEVLLLPTQLPTPVLAFAVRYLEADAGVMVTASHNPALDNGYKVYFGGRSVTAPERGAQIVPPYDAQISACIEAAGPASAIPRSASGWTDVGPELAEAYVAAIVGGVGQPGVPPERPATPIRIVHTAMHGVGSQVALESLKRSGFTDVAPVPEQQQPDPDFPTVSFPNPEEPGALDLALALAQRVDADVVIANDPDADRCAVAVKDPREQANGGWRQLHGDELGCVLGEDLAGRLEADRNASSGGQAVPSAATTSGSASSADPARSASALPGDAAQPISAPALPEVGDTLVNSIVSSRLLGEIARAHGVPYQRTLTGFKWMGRVPGLAYAYEEAIGYCVRPDLVHDKDGLSTGVAVARLVARLKASGQTLVGLLDDLARAHGLHLTSQLAVRFADRGDIVATVARLREAPPSALADSPVTAVADLADGYDGLPPTDGILLLTARDDRVIVRPSGTEPKVKCYLEVVEPVASDASFDALTAARSAAAERLEALKDDLRYTIFA